MLNWRILHKMGNAKENNNNCQDIQSIVQERCLIICVYVCLVSLFLAMLFLLVIFHILARGEIVGRIGALEPQTLVDHANTSCMSLELVVSGELLFAHVALEEFLTTSWTERM